MEVIRKISLGTINGVRKGFKDVKSTLFVARIFGVVNSTAVEPTPSGGTQVKFVGEFGAVSMERKAFGAPVAFLPAQAETALHSAVVAAHGKPVKFAYDVYAAPDSSPVGYSITVQALMDPVPMLTLNSIAESLPELPAVADLLTGDANKPAESGDADKAAEIPTETPAETPPPAPAPSKGKGRK